MAGSLLKDQMMAKAVSNIKPRSERQPDVATLQRTYVETGVFPQLNNSNHQILYGRRGTGKSHVLRILELDAQGDRRSRPIYIDVRILGSAQLMTDDSRPLVVRCVSVFKDLLSIIQSELLDIATDPDWEGGIEEVSDLADAIVARSAAVSERRVEQDQQHTTIGGSKLGATLSPSPSVSSEVADTTKETAGTTITYTETLRETVVFAEVGNLLDRALKALDIQRLYLLIDEWTAIPPVIQPYVAEFIKRTLLPSNRITVKIASLEYRSNFTIGVNRGNPIGFELGSDIFANLDLDDYYVYDRNPGKVADIFLELLYKHVESESPRGYLRSLGISNASQLRTRLFTEPATFVELVRAGEGVVRDFLGIFSSAFFRAQRSGRQKIEMNSVEEAARDWFETDKSTTLSADLRDTLNKIMTDVIGGRQATMFMLAREHGGHPRIQALFDLRLIHLISRGYSDKENPGLRYNIYSLDYGTYVDLKRTKKQPSSFVAVRDDDVAVDRIVPFADKRSIRRVILDPAILGS